MAAKNNKKPEKGGGDKQSSGQQPSKATKKNPEKTAKKNPVSVTKKTEGKTKGTCARSGGCRVASSCCKWLFGSFVLIIAIAAAINFDVHTHGGVFESSATGQFLKNTGMLPYAKTVYYTGMSNGARGYQFMEEVVPVYSKQTKEVLTPYWDFFKDLFVVSSNGFKQGLSRLVMFVEEKSPVVTDFIEKYAPGLPDKIRVSSVKAWVFISNTSYDVYVASQKFVNEKILVGKFSPESLNKLLNETQSKAADCYQWFKVRVDEYAKL